MGCNNTQDLVCLLVLIWNESLGFMPLLSTFPSPSSEGVGFFCSLTQGSRGNQNIWRVLTFSSGYDCCPYLYGWRAESAKTVRVFKATQQAAKLRTWSQSNVRFKSPEIIVPLLSHERWAGLWISRCAVVQRSAKSTHSKKVEGWIVLPVLATSPETCMSGWLATPIVRREDCLPLSVCLINCRHVQTASVTFTTQLGWTLAAALSKRSAVDKQTETKPETKQVQSSSNCSVCLSTVDSSVL